MLNVGDFDERIFLGDDASVEIGTPQKPTAETVRGEISKMQRKKTMEQQFEVSDIFNTCINSFVFDSCK